MGRKGQSITLSVSTEERETLEQIAVQFGCTWGENPNISALLKAIASGALQVYWSNETPPPKIKKESAKAAIEKIKQGLDELSRSL